MTGRGRLPGQSDSFFQAVAVMVTICNAKHDAIDANTYAAMLPKEWPIESPKTTIDTGLPVTKPDHPPTILGAQAPRSATRGNIAGRR